MKFFKSREKEVTNDTNALKVQAKSSPQVKSTTMPKPTVTAATTKPVEKKPATTPTSSYDLNTLIKKITTITADYNQVRTQLQSQLFTELDEQRQTKTKVQQTIVTTNQALEATTTKLAELKKLDSVELEAQLKKDQTSITSLNQSQLQLKQTLSTLADQLKVITARQKSLQAAKDKLTKSRDEIVTKLHAEADPLKILSLAEAYRERLENLEKQTKQLAEQQSQADAEAVKLNVRSHEAETDLRELNEQLKHAQSAQTATEKQLSTEQRDQKKQLASQEQQLNQLKQTKQRSTEQLAQLTKQIEHNERQLANWFGTVHRVLPLPVDEHHQYAVALDAFLPKHPVALVQTVQRLLSMGANRVGLYSELFDINLSSEIDLWANENGLDRDHLTIINPLYQIQNQGNLTGEPVKLPQNIAKKQWDPAQQILNVILSDNSGQLQVKYRLENPELIGEISYITGNQLTKRSFFDSHGLLSANALFNADGSLAQEQYYRRDGLVGLTIDYQGGQQAGVALFDGAGIQTNTFINTESMIAWWMHHYFPQGCALVGHIASDNYNQFVHDNHITAVPFVSEDFLTSEQLHDYLQQPNQQQFIVANYQTAQALIQNTANNLELGYLNSVYLPSQIAGPMLDSNSLEA
ncbi:hypothetical protein RA086_01430 [Lactiplantibacillus sp. WILCCON 0030]|uniref:Chromosome partition protein Smc n=1 Tax=Lactiplantibacillus brownii TaxID=3069269 RepID=A0ABU1A5Y7_9LACO|nr:hypothetical protein [Lactiplantibacillus brownii]MDQ7936313.1 hypothetical protein [Lactiplantibacillus brownii]